MTHRACRCGDEPDVVAARRRDLAIAGSAFACLVTAFAMPPSAAESGPVVCPFRLLTGLPCPGCGLTRSWVALAHGDLGAAFARHPFGPLLFVLAVVAVGATAYSFVRRRAPVDLVDRVESRPALALAGIWCSVWFVGLLA